jgi:hypothetical protein
MPTKIADARHNPRTKQEVFEDIKEKKNEKQLNRKEKDNTPKYKPGFDHGLQED